MQNNPTIQQTRIIINYPNWKNEYTADKRLDLVSWPQIFDQNKKQFQAVLRQ